MAVYNATPHHTTLLPEIRIACMYCGNIPPEWVFKALCLGNDDLHDRFVLDDDNPDYIIATDKCFGLKDDCLRLQQYLKNNEESIFIFFTRECLDPNLNLFDYAFTWNPDLVCGDRVIHNFPEMYRPANKTTLINTLTREEAINRLKCSLKFCNFMYSHPSEPRDTFFRLLSEYRRVDSLGAHLNNTGTPSTRWAKDWYSLSIDMKKNYKFSIAMENASYKGYTTEKIISSLEAHTVPIYWGDPAVTDYINPKAIINCNDYSSFDEVIERVKEIDSNDDLWLDMVTQEWQTKEQRSKTIQAVADYGEAVRNIFSQDSRQARRRPIGAWYDMFRRGFTGVIGIVPPPPALHIRIWRRIRRAIGRIIPSAIKPAVKKFINMK